MQSRHFIEVLIETYERVYSATLSGALTDAAEGGVLDIAIGAADAVAANGWHDQTNRAAAIAAALLRVRYGHGARDEAAGLCAAVRLAVLLTGVDPAPREAA